MGQSPSTGMTRVAEQRSTGTWALLKGFSDDGEPISVFEFSSEHGDQAQRKLVENGLQVGVKQICISLSETQNHPASCCPEIPMGTKRFFTGVDDHRANHSHCWLQWATYCTGNLSWIALHSPRTRFPSLKGIAAYCFLSP